MTASVPSKTALATSETSARVGTASVVMLCSICASERTIGFLPRILFFFFLTVLGKDWAEDALE